MKQKEIVIRGDFTIEEMSNGKHYLPISRGDVLRLLLAVREVEPTDELEKMNYQSLDDKLKYFLEMEWA
jgi:hypothetical protein